MSGFLTSANIHSKGGQFGVSIVDVLTSNITLWTEYPNKPHRFIFNTSIDREVILPSISQTINPATAIIGHSIIITNQSTNRTITVMNNASPAVTVADMQPESTFIFIAEEATDTWEAVLLNDTKRMGGLRTVTGGGTMVKDTYVLSESGAEYSITLPPAYDGRDVYIIVAKIQSSGKTAHSFTLTSSTGSESIYDPFAASGANPYVTTVTFPSGIAVHQVYHFRYIETGTGDSTFTTAWQLLSTIESLNNTYKYAPVEGNTVDMDSTQGPIILDDATGIGSVFRIQDSANKYLDVHNSYFAAGGTTTLPASGSNAVAVGANNNPGTSTNCILIGSNTLVSANNSIAIGGGNSTTGAKNRIDNTCNIRGPHIVRKDNSEGQTNAHTVFTSAITSYTTVVIDTTGTFIFEIPTGSIFFPTGYTVCDTSGNNFNVQLEIGTNSDSTVYLGSTSFTTSSFSYYSATITASNLIGVDGDASPNTGLTVNVTTLSSGEGRVSVHGILIEKQ